jgi:hypothetical protein
MILWYYGISIWIYILSHSDWESERSERVYIRRPPTEVGAPATGRVLLFLPTVHSYGGDARSFLSLWIMNSERFVVWYYDIMILWCYGIMVLWYYGIMVLWYYGIMVLWYYGIMILWYYGIMVLVFEYIYSLA